MRKIEKIAVNRLKEGQFMEFTKSTLEIFTPYKEKL
jgi:hypothetical protein